MFSSWFFWLFLGATTICHTSAVPGHQQFRRQDGPVPPDTVKDCTYFYDSQPRDTCASIASDWGITLQQFLTYNPSVKPDCSGLRAGNAYCVEENYGNGPVAPSTKSSTPPITSALTTTTPTSTRPSPVQSGINAQCTTLSFSKLILLMLGAGKQYYKVQSGDTCAGIVDIYHSFTLQNLSVASFLFLAGFNYA